MNALRKTLLSLSTIMLASSLAGTGCITDTEDTGPGGKPEDNGKLVDGKADAWNSTNNPERFEIDFDYTLANLPMSGKAETTPWPDTYWPTYKDSSNQRWQGQQELSPLEKYDMAFNNWEPDEAFYALKPYTEGNCESKGWDQDYYEKLGPSAKWMSKNKGNWNAHDGKDSDGDGEIDECDDNDGVETWWGLCHAWVPASILEKEPQHSVTHNGVTFEVGDIKGLLQTAYDRTSAYMLGGRCNEKEVERDEHGRIKADHCRDTNAGSFHVVVTNMLGIHKRSFAEDRTYDYQVWNQPFRSYEILGQEEVDAKAAMAALGHDNAETYTFNEDAVRFAKVRTRVEYITEPHQTSTDPLVPEVDDNGKYTGTDTYDYIVEMDADGKVIGGEWLKYSQTTHPDFLWLPIRAGSWGGNPHIDLDMIHELLELSTKVDNPGGEVVIRTFESSTEIAIPDNDPTGITDTIEVTEELTVGSLKVKVEIDHSYIGDLKVVLMKGDMVVPLHDRVGAGADDLNKTFEPSDFAGQSAKGTWTLKVSDHASWDKGTLKKWSMIVSTGTVAAPQEFAAGNVNMSIPDNNATGITNVLNVDESGTLKKLQVKVDLTHTYIGDLTVSLTHGGSNQVLHAREGGSSDNIIKTFSPDAFNGSSLQGDWTLRVKDSAGQDVGTLNSWSILATVQ